ncbi:MAG TPA: SGNH/GDSL hydrolase family protein, partial [Draconibacterium sp.]|nr:SGNH/GDSL hydrolase family protein [Draconibacterium sp.]
SIFLVMASFIEKKPKILIIGDSISIGYTPFVKEQLSDNAIVVHNPGNAQHTETGLKKIEAWIGNEEWDIIQFNWGLWDLCYRMPAKEGLGPKDKINGKITIPIEKYMANLDSLVSFLQKKTKAKLIFVTTTYVPENEPGRFAKDPLKYNKAAKKVMKKHGIEVNDIYKESKKIHAQFGQGEDNVHYKKNGYRKLGEIISSFLEKKMQALKTD